MQTARQRVDVHRDAPGMMQRAASSIAVVDDESRVLESMRDLLESAGYTAHLFPSPRALLVSGLLQSIDCLITDIGLPEIDGFELCRRTRMERPDLPVIFVTARHDMADETRAERARNSGFFRKPFSAAALLAAVDRALAGRRDV